jgi:nitroreductase
MISPGADMEIPFSQWHAAIPRRRSRRRYDSITLEPTQLNQLQTLCGEFRPYPEARAEMLSESPERVLRGIAGSYGKVQGAPALIAFIGDTNDRYVNEKIGYTGEGIILEATSMGLGTCWVGGSMFFRRGLAESIVGTSKNERVFAVTPVGYAVKEFSTGERVQTGFGMFHRRKPLMEMVSGLDKNEWPGWVKAALEAARLAPSAINRQPWRFYVEPDSITISVNSPLLEWGISKRLDCGIAMLHIEVAALDCGVKGRWELLKAPQVARFTV